MVKCLIEAQKRLLFLISVCTALTGKDSFLTSVGNAFDEGPLCFRLSSEILRTKVKNGTHWKDGENSWPLCNFSPVSFLDSMYAFAIQSREKCEMNQIVRNEKKDFATM